jgi:quercetin dioxygenase-like cupin family protein
VSGAGEARAVVWPGTGASLRSMQRISLGSGSRTHELVHPSEAVYYVIAGSGHVSEPGGQGEEVVEGSMVLIETGTRYAFVAGAAGMEFVGGPCPADPSLYEGVEGYEGLTGA